MLFLSFARENLHGDFCQPGRAEGRVHHRLGRLVALHDELPVRVGHLPRRKPIASDRTPSTLDVVGSGPNHASRTREVMSVASSFFQQKLGYHYSLRRSLASGAAATVAALLLSVCAVPSSAGASALRPSAKPVVTPDEVPSIVATDTAINNRANSSLSLSLQNSHESCLQQILDDATYRGDLAAGSNTLGGPFDQVPGRVFVPNETTYPAFFSVLAEDRVASEPVTNNLLTYVKTSPDARWKLASSSEILGPADAGVAVPAAATNARGYVTSLDRARTDGLVTAPDTVAELVARAFTSEAVSGKLPAGFSAQFGPKNVANPHSIAASYANLGKVRMRFSTVTPAAAAAGAPSPKCPFPAYRLADGRALVTFPVFATTVVQIKAGYVVTQPSNRSALGVLLPPGTYNSITMVEGDMDVAVVPPARSTPADPSDRPGERRTDRDWSVGIWSRQFQRSRRAQECRGNCE